MNGPHQNSTSADKYTKPKSPQKENNSSIIHKDFTTIDAIQNYSIIHKNNNKFIVNPNKRRHQLFTSILPRGLYIGYINRTSNQIKTQLNYKHFQEKQLHSI